METIHGSRTGMTGRVYIAKAFRGELVLQDQYNEPDNSSLVHIRAERAAPPQAMRGSRSRMETRP